MGKVDWMFRAVIVVLLSYALASSAWAQERDEEMQFHQVIRGVVTDFASGRPLADVAVLAVDKPEVGAVTDTLGHFQLSGLPVGRHTVRASVLGYESGVVKEILLTSVKDVYIEISLKESVLELGEIVIRPHVSKEQPLNKMATTGVRMLSVEEASRYAGGFDDPARLASSFSGVSSEGATNGISIHGNAPHLLLWRLEGVEIPNPNHFADISILGGGIFSSLSSQVLGNSDFFTGAFPAEYGNAVSGVFDMKLRNGNSHRHEHTVQVGVAGIDVASEGPLGRRDGASYIVNYRYSMTGLVNKMGLMDMDGQKMDYQDLNFKLNFPLRNAGTLCVWGTGLIDHFVTEQKDTAQWKYTSDRTRSASTQYMAAGGLTHSYFFHGGGLLKTSLAGTFFKEHADMDSYDKQMSGVPYMDMYRQTANLVAAASYTRKFNARFTGKAGITYTRMFYDMDMQLAEYYEQPMQPVYSGKGNTGLLAAYTSNAWRLCDALSLNVGMNVQWLALNDVWTLEPRAGIKWQWTEHSALAVAYGMHSRSEKTDVYFVRVGGEEVNRKLGFTKAHHFMLTYVWKLSENVNLKVEPYYQYLYNVPVEAGTSYSVLNRNDFYLDKALVNKGKGKNYGIDLTLERYLERGWYAMLTGSLFSSRYCGGDGVWHSSRYNRHFIVNALGGKEWLLGHRKQNLLSVNLKCTVQGGECYSPIDVEATMAHPDREVQYDETRAYSQRYSPVLVLHYTVSYKLNRKKVSHEFAVKHINATGTKSYYGHSYNLRTGKIEADGFALSLPNLSYKLEF